MKVKDLISRLEDFNPESEVRLAFQKHYPLEYSVGAVEAAEVDTAPEESEVVYIGERSQIGYLPGEAARALGWRD